MQKLSYIAILLALTALASARTSAVTVQEDFSANPAGRGWQISGDASLFQWNSGALNVTWDSSRSNSYFHLPLGTTLTRADSFSVSFDLRLTDFNPGINPLKPNVFELSAGFIDLADATSPQFLRGTGYDSPDILEFSFFPDPAGLWTSVTGVAVDSTGTNWSSGGWGNFGLLVDDVYRITLAYSASSNTLTTTVTLNGVPVGEVSPATLGGEFRDFAVDQFAICNYSDAGQDPAYAGSILAHGTVDNVTVEFPDRLQGSLTAAGWEMRFWTMPKRLYSVERTTDGVTWETVSAPIPGTGAPILWLDSTPPAERAFYRVGSTAQ
jgi:hypothetical protein